MVPLKKLDLDTASDNDLTTYIKSRYDTWKLQLNITGNDFWDTYHHDFGDWEKDHFEKTQIGARKALRKGLIEKGVYVKPYTFLAIATRTSESKTSQSLTEVLLEVLNAKQPVEWNKELLAEVISEYNSGGREDRLKWAEFQLRRIEDDEDVTASRAHTRAIAKKKREAEVASLDLELGLQQASLNTQTNAQANTVTTEWVPVIGEQKQEQDQARSAAHKAAEQARQNSLNSLNNPQAQNARKKGAQFTSYQQPIAQYLTDNTTWNQPAQNQAKNAQGQPNINPQAPSFQPLQLSQPQPQYQLPYQPPYPQIYPQQPYQFPNTPYGLYGAIPAPPQELQAGGGVCKELESLTKIIKDEDRYSGDNTEAFDYKLNFFYALCMQVNLPQAQLKHAFLLILKGMARQYYISNNLHNGPTFEIAAATVKGAFESAGSHVRAQTAWQEVTWETIRTENPTLSATQRIQALAIKLQQMRHSLSIDLNNDSYVRLKIIMECEKVDGLQNVCANPPLITGHLVSSLQSAMMSHERIHRISQPIDTMYTDRRYNNDLQNTRYRDRRENRQDRGNDNNYNRGNDDRKRKTSGKCWICGKENHRAFMHSKREQDEERKKYKSRIRTAGSGRRFDQHFEEEYHHFVTDWEVRKSTSIPISEEERLDTFAAQYSMDVSSNSESDSDSDRENDTPSHTSTHFASYFNVAESTNSGLLSNEGAELIGKDLAERAVCHAVYHTTTAVNDDANTDDVWHGGQQQRYDDSTFYGYCIDTGAAEKSTAGMGQWKALQRIYPSIQLKLASAGKVNVRYGIGICTNIGHVRIPTPVGQVTFYIMPANIPFLFCLRGLDDCKVFFNNLENKLQRKDGSSIVSVIRRFGHAWFFSDKTMEHFVQQSFDMYPCYLTQIELKRLHRRFGHPSVERLRTLLEKAGHDDDDNKALLQKIEKYCHHCQKHQKSPGRFRFRLKDDQIEFNYCVWIDIVTIEGHLVLHIVDEATRYQAAAFLINKEAPYVFGIFRMIWIDCYQGPPDIAIIDQARELVSKDFQYSANELGIAIKAAPTEAHHSMGAVERYHGPLRRAYRIIIEELPLSRSFTKEMALQTAVKALNDSIGPNGLVPTLLVYGAYPRMTELDAPSPSIAQRSTAVKKAMSEVKAIHAKRQVSDAINMRNGPVVDMVHDLAINAKVLTWRERPGKSSGEWTGPHKLVSRIGEECVIRKLDTDNIFKLRTTHVRPYFNLEEVDDAQTEEENPYQAEQPEPSMPQDFDENHVPQRGRPKGAKNRVFQQTRHQPKRGIPLNRMPDVQVFVQDEVHGGIFELARIKEFSGLMEKSVFEVVNKEDIPTDSRIFNGRFVENIKFEGTEKAMEKSRYVIQGYNDTGKATVLTQSPTIQRMSQRLILCVRQMGHTDPHTKTRRLRILLRDVKQAYTQSLTKLIRQIFVRPNRWIQKYLDIARDQYLQVIWPLYGIPEAGNHWYNTYSKHHLDKLLMKQSTYDPCCLYRNEGCFAMVGLQTDDTLILCDDTFAKIENTEIQKAGFEANEIEELAKNHPIDYNGCHITLDNDVITITQQKQINKLQLVSNRPITLKDSRSGKSRVVSMREQYVIQRARGAYMATVCQPEVAFGYSYCAQIEPNETNLRVLNKLIQWQLDNRLRGLRMVHLDASTMKVVVFCDASFAGNTDLTSQLGYLVAIVDGNHNANIIHWSSTKCKRITKSVLASELYAMGSGFDAGAVIKSTLDAALSTQLSTPLPLVICTDSKSLYDCLVKLGTTVEKRLMIDVLAVRQSYERRQITEVKWIAGNSNPADALTKFKPGSALSQLIDTNRIDVKAMGWVNRLGELAEGDLDLSSATTKVLEEEEV